MSHQHRSYSERFRKHVELVSSSLQIFDARLKFQPATHRQRLPWIIFPGFRSLPAGCHNGNLQRPGWSSFQCNCRRHPNTSASTQIQKDGRFQPQEEALRRSWAHSATKLEHLSGFEKIGFEICSDAEVKTWYPPSSLSLGSFPRL